MPGLGGTVWRKLRLPHTFRDAVPGGETPSGESFLRCSSPWCSSSPRYWRECATLPWGFILSPSATLRVAGLAPRVKVEHTTV